MAPDTSHISESVRDRVSEAEWQTRVDLAAVYRLIARFGWDDGIYTHNSARVPGHEDQMLINPYGLMFSEITASSLVKVNLEGTIIDGGEDTDIIDAGYVIHSAVHAARGDVHAVCHTHTVAGMAVSAQAGGLLPLTQTSLRFYDRLAYHDFEGIADDINERERLVEDLGSCRSMILRNHGLLTTGRSISEAFGELRYLQRACESQIAAQSGGGDLNIPPPEVCEHTAQQFDESGDNSSAAESTLVAMKRMLDREEPSYAS